MLFDSVEGIGPCLVVDDIHYSLGSAIIWDCIERELPLVRKWDYCKFPFAQQTGTVTALFSNIPIEYVVPQAVLFSFMAAFTVLVDVDSKVNYMWICAPSEAWKTEKRELASALKTEMKHYKNNLEAFVLTDDF